ncbi:uncharacterized protein LOC110038395 [Phalaenopsis equestris]|uniref:uncharacterized protein LOC110038395 n=1 Tax=Phalaenopsis equestris TaxID=78828 RepID=UPI0009E5A0EC|nr:uncharacterized protein LOC110038395 [Phalaenopsis equestris]
MTRITTTFIISSILVICISPITAQSPPSPTPDVNLTNLLSISGPFNTLLTLLTQTNVIETFQNQAKNTDQGITIFAPSDTAFSKIDKSSLSNLTKDQVNSLLLYHAFPKYYTLSNLSNLSNSNPVTTLAGEQYTVNLTDANGLIRVISDWSNSEINGSVCTVDPIALYEVNDVLLPKAIFNTTPGLTPAPAPVPTPAPQFVNLTNLLTNTGPYQIFLNLLTQTNVIQTFQNQANKTNQGITIFAPSDSAFSKIDKSSLSNLTKDQVNSLLLYHAFPKFYSISNLSNLSSHNPVTTFAGKQYTLNLTDTNGLIRVISDWSSPEINNNIYSVDPVSIYEVNSVLLPKSIFTTAPVQAPQIVNLTNLLTITGPFHTFLSLLIQTNVIQTFQSQANNTDQGITIFAPSDSAFSKIDKSSLSNLSKDQVNSLLLYHAFQKFYSLSNLSKLSSHNPVTTIAGKQYTLNITDTNGLVRVISDWSNPEINGTAYSTNPVAIYEVNSVLLPKAIFNTAPTLAPQFVNLTNLLTNTGPFHSFLNLLIQTNVIQTFQNQANNTDQGITIFAPSDSAFSKIDKFSLSKLSKDQVNSLLLYHAFPKFYSLSDLSNLSNHNPVTTIAGKQYTLNLTDTNGLIRVISDWSNPEINGSVYSTNPVALYEVNSVLFPKAIFTTAPTLTPAPTPAPEIAPNSDLSPAGQQPENNNSSSSVFAASTFAYILTVLLGLMML